LRRRGWRDIEQRGLFINKAGFIPTIFIHAQSLGELAVEL
jgi:hypothetical protein